MPTTHVDGVDLAYALRGDGPRVLVLLGSAMTLAGAGPLLSLFGEGCTLLSFDYRGLGASTPSPGPYGMAACAADAMGVLDAVGWDTARVVGVSFGGMVAQELAVTVPHRIERLGLLCTSAGGAGGASYPLHELEDLDPAARATARRRLLDTRFDEAWLADHPGDRALVELLDRRADDDDPDTAPGRRAQLAARRGHDVWDRLGAVACPTLVACGRYDPIAPMANSEAIASRITGAELRAYDGGHAFFVQDRSALPEIVAFLTGTGLP
jgi:3-oxoadipate enol-lactonase